MPDLFGNGPPDCAWHKTEMPCGTVRQRLRLVGEDTPYFIDTNDRLGHRSQGQKHGLYGAGMHKGGCALLLACGTRIAELKHHAEQMALAT